MATTIPEAQGITLAASSDRIGVGTPGTLHRFDLGGSFDASSPANGAGIVVGLGDRLAGSGGLLPSVRLDIFNAAGSVYSTFHGCGGNPALFSTVGTDGVQRHIAGLCYNPGAVDPGDDTYASSVGGLLLLLTFLRLQRRSRRADSPGR